MLLDRVGSCCSGCIAATRLKVTYKEEQQLLPEEHQPQVLPSTTGQEAAPCRHR